MMAWLARSLAVKADVWHVTDVGMPCHAIMVVTL
jgi:hypothetical protein